MINEKPVVMQFVGTLVDRPHFDKTGKGRPVANGKIETRDPDTGKTNHFPIKAWDENAKKLKDMRAGDDIVVEGCLEQERWNNKETNAPHTRTVIVLSAVELYDDGGDGLDE